jgi:hypothetical protein
MEPALAGVYLVGMRIGRGDSDRMSERARSEVAALADGSLPASRRAEVEAMVRESPELQELLRAQRAALTAIRAAAAPAPAGLRARIDHERSAAARRGHRRRLVTGFALAAACAAVILAVVLPAGAPEGPSVAEASALALRPATAPAPGQYDGQDVLLDRQVDGIHFPRWAAEFGWRATGARVDRLDGHRAVTVFYVRGERRIAYTIVSGRSLPKPGAQAVRRGGTELRELDVRGRSVVTWQRRGHTCVLSGARVDPRALLALASWRAGGRLAY